MFPLIFVIIWIIAVSAIVKGIKTQSGGTTVKSFRNVSASVEKPVMPAAAAKKTIVKPLAKTPASGRDADDGEYDREPVVIRPSGLKAGSGLNSNLVLHEDRANDWMARQLREEARILRGGNGLDLGASHAASCDAHVLKEEHLGRHGKD